MSSKSDLAMMSAGRASGFELVEEQIVFNRRKSRHGTGESMANLYKKYKFDDKDTGNNNSRACTVYISASSWKDGGQLVPCSFFIQWIWYIAN